MQQPSTSPVFEFDAIGTRWWCEMLDASMISDDLQRKTLQLCDEFNRAYSRFRDDSLIGQLNANKVLPHPPQELCDMFALCHELYIASDGVFNISMAVCYTPKDTAVGNLAQQRSLIFGNILQ